ncbi:hypothetical protein DFH11DRAFT_1778589 [Phellopilus nigrolimitatus]|nr:hypothetical protein DFH11DRAFT_1778589 [Phellopilus nigrolimitatus]
MPSQLNKLPPEIKLDNTTRDGKRLNPAIFLDQLRRWIQNSGNVPISIKFSYMHLSEHDSYEEYCKEMKDIVDLLLTCQHRWHTLKIYVKNFSVVKGLLHAMSNLDNAPQLQEFKLEVDDEKNAKYSAWKAYTTALTLQPKGEHSGYARLTGLELSGSPSTESIMWWIKRAPELKTLDVSTNIEQPEHHQLSPPHVWNLAHVSKLHIFGLKYSHIGPLLAQLRFPVLTDLYVNVGGTELDTSSIVKDLLHCSKPQMLEKLTFCYYQITETTSVLKYLNQCPNLVYLKVAPTTEPILDALAASSGAHPYCPNLEELEISLSGPFPSFEKLQNLVHSRSHDTRFKSLKKLTVPDNLKKPQYRALEKLGLEVAKRKW